MDLATNPMYANNLEQTHDLFGSTSADLSLKTRVQPPLHDFSHGLVNSKIESES